MSRIGEHFGGRYRKKIFLGCANTLACENFTQDFQLTTILAHTLLNMSPKVFFPHHKQFSLNAVLNSEVHYKKFVTITLYFIKFFKQSRAPIMQYGASGHLPLRRTASKKVSYQNGKYFPPGKYPTEKIAPQNTAPQENCSLEKCLPGKTVPIKFLQRKNVCFSFYEQWKTDMTLLASKIR